MSSLIVIMMASPKAYDVLVSGVWRAKWIVSCWAKTVLFQNFQISLIWVRKMSKRKTEKEKKFACTEALSEKQGDRWDSRGRLRGEEGEDENNGSREDFYLLGIVLCMCGFLLRYIWFAATKLSCAIQKQIETDLLDIILTKGMPFSFLGKNV